MMGDGMDLKEFYFQNIKEDEYHYRFLSSIQNVNKVYNVFSGEQEMYNYSFELYDTEEVIQKFRELCQPEVSFAGKENTCWFYLVTYYLYKNGYELKEFPRLLARPPVDPSEFTYKDIRNRMISEGKDDGGTVRYAARRVYVANLTFEVKTSHIEVDESIDQKFIEISTRNASFNSMSLDEKLSEIANLTENLLKKNGKYVELDYSKICFEYISDDEVKSFRKKLHCFRHSSDEAIQERESYSDEQKNFMIDYGLTIIKVIYSLVQ